MRERRAILTLLALVSVVADAGAGWPLSPSNQYTDGRGLVHNQQSAWVVPAGYALRPGSHSMSHRDDESTWRSFIADHLLR